MNNKTKYVPIIVVLLFYLMELSYGFQVAIAQNDISYIILALTAPLPLLLGIIFSVLILARKKQE